MRFDTPKEIANALARHLPRRPIQLLEPAVGEGALLAPALNRMAEGSEVCCLDTDAAAISHVNKSLVPDTSCTVRSRQADFLKWSQRGRRNSFDCVLMNPPFASRRGTWVRQASGTQNGSGSSLMPVEAAFILQALSVLKSRGLLLAIVPPWIVSSESAGWLRANLRNQGSFRVVHELPKRCFTNLESRIYLIVFEKGRFRHSIEFQNHDIRHPERRVVPSGECREDERLDFGYWVTKTQMNKVHAATSSLEWLPVYRLADVYRGRAASPEGTQVALHTCDQAGGMWHVGTRHKILESADDCRTVRRGDILTARVGRDCLASLGIYKEDALVDATDCILIIRVKEGLTPLQLLFSLKSVLSIKGIRSVLTTGGGASYISMNRLRNLHVPFRGPSYWHVEYQRFRRAVWEEDFRRMNAATGRIGQRLLGNG